MSFIDRIIAYMEKNKYKIFRKTGEKNIVYVEGCDTDGEPNPDTANHFNDVRLVFGFRGLTPVIEGAWEGTTEPGYYYTDNPMNPNGAARIAFGQYRAWQVGIHGNSEPHEALEQVDLVRVCRDYNRDLIRTGDAIDEGYFGINQHYGYDHPYNDIHTASAGCLVGRTREGHRKFMRLIKSDPRYLENQNFLFTTTILNGSKI
jgi:Uncharacterized protein conserved in archaea